MPMSLHDAAKAACAEVGIVYRDVPADGRFHETDLEDDPRGRGDGRIKLFPCGEGGMAWNWKGKSRTFFVESGRQLSESERLDNDRKRQKATRQAEEENVRRKAEAAQKAAAIWKAAIPAKGDHPYLTRKRVSPVPNLREIDAGAAMAILGYAPKSSGEQLTGRLLVAPVTVGDELSTLELIDEAGRKSALYGGAKAGGYWAAQSLLDGNIPTLLIGEGVATVLTAKEASGHPAIAALSAGNLPSVAKAMRERYPAVSLVVLADLVNATGAPDPHAIEAARAVGGRLAAPNFGTERRGGATDFNDLASHLGEAAVKACIKSAAVPQGDESGAAMPTPSDVSPKARPSDSDRQEWPEPLPLPEGLPAVVPFDFALLPDSLRPWAEDICERVQCPPDFVGATIMAALGSVIGRRIGIRPQAQTDWTEVPNQWALIVGRPGVLKSPAMEAALSPLKRLASQAVESHHSAMEEYQQTARLAKLRAEASEKVARGKLAKNPRADVLGDLVGDEALEPALRRYIANDTTAAALGELLRQSPNGLLVFRDEMVSLLKGLEREDNAEARGFYLTGWNGTSGYTFDRIGRGMNLHIEAVCLSLLGSTQPGRIAEYLRAAVKGGAGDDGLIQRFGLLVWPDTGAAWRDVDRWPDSEARRKANAVFEALNALAPASIGAQQDEFSPVPFLRFHGEALVMFREWRETWEAKLRGSDLHPALESHLAKYRKLVPGLALSLHLADGGSGAVGKRPTLQALAWAEYLETHARRAYASVMTPEVTTAKAILEKLRRGELSHTFAARDIYRRGWAHLSEREHVLDALQLLADLDRLAVYTRGTEGRTATVYQANPRGLTP